MRIVDTNIVLRYMLDDHAELSPMARQIIDNNTVQVPIEVLCEVVFVLLKLYKVSRADISVQLHNFCEQTACILPHREAILKGLLLFATHNLDFVDCILVGYKQSENAEIETFDAKLQKILKSIK